MVVSRAERQLRISIDEQMMQVPCFKYLGVQIDECGKLREGINARVAAAGRLFSAINRKFLSGQGYKNDSLPLNLYTNAYVWQRILNPETVGPKPPSGYGNEIPLRKIKRKTRRDRIRQPYEQCLKVNPSYK